MVNSLYIHYIYIYNILSGRVYIYTPKRTSKRMLGSRACRERARLEAAVKASSSSSTSKGEWGERGWVLCGGGGGGVQSLCLNGRLKDTDTIVNTAS